MKWMIASDIHGSAFYCEQMLSAFLREGADRILLLGDLLYHGPRNDLDNPPLLKAGDVLLHGHTHVPAKDSSLGFWYLNPGSVAIPKEGSAHSYMTLENGVFTWKDLEGVEYDQLVL